MMNERETVQLFKCLADKTRLQILRSLANEDMDVERLAQRLNVTPPTISFHLKKLADAGAVSSYKEQYYTFYSLHREIFMKNILDFIQIQSDEADLQAQRDHDYREKIIASFFEYGKLKSLPTQRKKKRIVLEEIVKSFKVNQIYTEREVNIMLADYHDDFCTLRRDMVEAGLLKRDQEGYQRSCKYEKENR